MPGGAGRLAEAARALREQVLDNRVALLAGCLLVATLAIQLTVLSDGRALFDDPVIPLWLLVPIFALTDGFVIHIQVRRGGHAISLSEIPLVLGLLSVHPGLLMVARVGGALAGLVLFRRQRGTKLAFNLALFALEATVASMVFRLLVGAGDPLGPTGWLGVYGAMFTADLLAVFLVTTVISIQDDPGEWRRLPGSCVQGLPLTATSTSIALVTAMVVQRDVRAVAILGVVTLVAYLAYRGYVRQNQGQAQVEGLYEFTRILGGSLEADQIIRIVLEQARDQLRAGAAELIVSSSDGRPWMRIRMSGQGELETMLATIDEEVWWRPALGREPVLLPPHPPSTGRGTAEVPVDGMAVPVSTGTAELGVLLVVNSLPDIPTFDDDHLRLFQALANHASVALANARLVDTLRREVSEKEHLALHDQLTGLPNRPHFHGLLAEELADAGSTRGTAVMLMDLDRFKEVNDALGHDTGDALLHELGDRLQRRIGSRGTVARLGGDEFAVLLPGVGTPEEVLAVGEDLTREMESVVTVGTLTLTTRASIGVALAPAHGEDAKTLLRRADVAMYAAKSSQADIRIYEPEDDQNSPRRLALVTDLREAISNQELTVVYQPKVAVPSGVVIGAEALTRWRHYEYGFVSPVEFVALAEHAGLIRALTLHVLEVALQQCAAWRAAGHDLHVAVNLSPRSLVDTGLPDIVARLLLQTQVQAGALTLEITEGSVIADPIRAIATLENLHGLGVRLAIDDFGTGYSSLGRLRDMPLHEVKIDKSFVQGMAADEGDQAVVRSAVQLGRALGLEVVAEGVEDMETYAQLCRSGCSVVQGYFLSPPLPADEFDGWLEHYNARTQVGQVKKLRGLTGGLTGA